MHREPGVELGQILDPLPHAIEHAQRRPVTVVQVGVALGRQSMQPVGVGQDLLLGGKVVVLSVGRVRIFDLAQLKRDHLGSFLPARRLLPDSVQIGSCLPPRRKPGAHITAQRTEIRVPVQQIQMTGGIEQRLVLVLTVQVEQLGAKRPKPAGRDQAVVDERPAATLRRHFPAEDPLAAVGRLGRRLDDSLVRAGAHDIG